MLIRETARYDNLRQARTGIAHQGFRSLYSSLKQELIGRLPRALAETPDEVRYAQSRLACQIFESKVFFQARFDLCDTSTQSRRRHTSNGIRDHWQIGGIATDEAAP